MKPFDAMQRVKEEMVPIFPLGVFKDVMSHD
jgi:2-oxoglutarate ferredoxin oxidoreductase subunit beta